MTPRPFYRWKSFWFGLLVLVFLGWVWADSQRHGAVVYRMNFLEGGRRRCFVYDEGVSLQRGRIMFHGSRLKMREPSLVIRQSFNTTPPVSAKETQTFSS